MMLARDGSTALTSMAAAVRRMTGCNSMLL
jgi:hypothetical protein